MSYELEFSRIHDPPSMNLNSNIYKYDDKKMWYDETTLRKRKMTLLTTGHRTAFHAEQKINSMW